MNLNAINMNKDCWEDPSKFSPERFLDSENNIINSEKLLTFGVGMCSITLIWPFCLYDWTLTNNSCAEGPRKCIGEVLANATIFVFLTSLVQRFAFEISPFHDKPTTEPEFGMTLSPKSFHVLVKERNNQNNVLKIKNN